MNIFQDNYCKARALCDTVKAQQEQNEQKFIAERGIVNPDGAVPERIFQIDASDAEFSSICEEFDFSEYDLFDELVDAEKLLRQAEDELIDFGLSIIPESVREVLDRNRDNPRYRQKLIDIIMKLDTRTIKGGTKRA